MEERPTLVVWLFDASGSLTRRRQEIRERFTKIYDELGIVQKMREEKMTKREREQERLLTSVFSFGQKVELLTEQPTSNLSEITDAIDSIEMDVSGIEQVFTAVYLAADKYKSYRSSRGGNGEARNVMMVVVSDERGDDAIGLEKTIEVCRKFAMPVYVMGVPAPFGREYTYIKYVDPDPASTRHRNGLRSIRAPRRIIRNESSLATKTTILKSRLSIPVSAPSRYPVFVTRQVASISRSIRIASSIVLSEGERPRILRLIFPTSLTLTSWRGIDRTMFRRLSISSL